MKALTVIFLAAMLLACSKEPIDIPLEKGWYVTNYSKSTTGWLVVLVTPETGLQYEDRIEIEMIRNERICVDLLTYIEPSTEQIAVSLYTKDGDDIDSKKFQRVDNWQPKPNQ